MDYFNNYFPCITLVDLFYYSHSIYYRMSELLFFYLAIISSFPVLMGAIRLARFNIDHSEENQSSYFIGLPSPMAAISICSIVLLKIELNSNAHFINIPNIHNIAQNIT